VKYHVKTPSKFGDNCCLVPNIAGKFVYRSTWYKMSLLFL